MTADEIRAEITEINTALSYIRKGGQSYMLMTSAGGGTQRSVTMADYDKLVRHRNELQSQLRELEDTRATRIRAGW